MIDPYVKEMPMEAAIRVEGREVIYFGRDGDELGLVFGGPTDYGRPEVKLNAEQVDDLFRACWMFLEETRRREQEAADIDELVKRAATQ